MVALEVDRDVVQAVQARGEETFLAIEAAEADPAGGNAPTEAAAASCFEELEEVALGKLVNRFKNRAVRQDEEAARVVWPGSFWVWLLGIFDRGGVVLG